MDNPRALLKEIPAFMRRRKWLLLLPPIIITVICAIGSLFLPRMYESTIRILVQHSDVVNPLASLANAITQTTDDPLQSFDEIIFSQRTFEQMIDSLGLSGEIHNEVERRAMMVKIRTSITTKMQERESFTITFQSTDPARAQRGAYALANIFINTVANTNIKRNKATVSFYKEKLDEYRQKMEDNQQRLMSQMRNDHSKNASENATMYARADQTDQKIKDMQNHIKDYQKILNDLSIFPEAMGTQRGQQRLFEIQRSGAPYAADLKPLLNSYDDATGKYTAKHPAVLKIEAEISDVLDRMKVAVQSEISKQNEDLDDLRRGKANIVEELLRSTHVGKSDQDVESNYMIYQKLYNEMKVKLEEAEITKSLDSNVGDQYIIMDPPLLPLFPSKPSRILIVGGGFVLGILLGILSAIVAEMLDTTIRSAQAMEVYGKPIIGFMPYNDRKKGYMIDQ